MPICMMLAVLDAPPSLFAVTQNKSTFFVLQSRMTQLAFDCTFKTTHKVTLEKQEHQ
jgi:hypothetical protein